MQKMTRRALGLARLGIDGDGLGGVGAAGAAGARPRRNHQGRRQHAVGQVAHRREPDGEARRAAADRGHGQERRSPTSRRARSSACRPCRSRTAPRRPMRIHIFLDAQKGVVADRFSDWDSRPGSTMTNANVATTVAGKDGQDLLVKYKDGEKKVIVPPGIPIAKYAAGQRRRPQGREKGLRRRRGEASRRHAAGAEYRGRPRHRSAAISRALAPELLSSFSAPPVPDGALSFQGGHHDNDNENHSGRRAARGVVRDRFRAAGADHARARAPSKRSTATC